MLDGAFQFISGLLGEGKVANCANNGESNCNSPEFYGLSAFKLCYVLIFSFYRKLLNHHT